MMKKRSNTTNSLRRDKMTDSFWNWYLRGLKKTFRFRWVTTRIAKAESLMALSVLIFLCPLLAMYTWSGCMSSLWLLLTIPSAITILAYAFWMVEK